MLSRTLSGWRRLLGRGDFLPQGEEEERRLWGRLPCDLETSCRAASGQGGDPLPARVRNISRGGISLRVAGSFEPGGAAQRRVADRQRDRGAGLRRPLRAE